MGPWSSVGGVDADPRLNSQEYETLTVINITTLNHSQPNGVG